MDSTEDEQLERVNSLPDVELASSSSSVSLSSVITSEDYRSATSSGEVSRTTTSSSGEIRALLVPSLVDPALSTAEEVRVAVARPKCVGRNNKGVTWGFTSVIGRRREMEDAVAVIPSFMSRTCDHVGGCTAPGSRSSAEISPVHFFGVYDGHGGNQVAKFCAERMHEVIAQEWDRETIDGYEWRRRWEAAFSIGFERADNELMAESVAPEMVGSTAVVAVLSGCQIIISNCGDSRALLCRGTETIPLTVDQKPDREDELKRIEGDGGKVINWNGARVFGVLAMSRAIGDRYLRPWIIPVPEVTFMTRTDEDECLILASDGLWDVMTNDEVGEVARHHLRRRRRSISTLDDVSPAQVVADYLTEIAYGRNSSDNISIVVVDLKTKRKRQQRL
ncbi:protein phosphatase 2C 56-like [Pyrus ussuriensis x Pyrus communis]|uniref:protein-serine/threonine phosphatase n=1 Tax=Pyrus ussuriensis x Pyrus communis TaxID=2448454 RepID=A0A5N5GZF2_9ROSA|nr:protein phosphatase 2C 56-like [Pyrus ussuriensis x Pyrus communis]